MEVKVKYRDLDESKKKSEAGDRCRHFTGDQEVERQILIMFETLRGTKNIPGLEPEG